MDCFNIYLQHRDATRDVAHTTMMIIGKGAARNTTQQHYIITPLSNKSRNIVLTSILLKCITISLSLLTKICHTNVELSLYKSTVGICTRGSQMQTIVRKHYVAIP